MSCCKVLLSYTVLKIFRSLTLVNGMGSSDSETWGRQMLWDPAGAKTPLPVISHFFRKIPVGSFHKELSSGGECMWNVEASWPLHFPECGSHPQMS